MFLNRTSEAQLTCTACGEKSDLVKIEYYSKKPFCGDDSICFISYTARDLRIKFEVLRDVLTQQCEEDTKETESTENGMVPEK